MLKKIKTFFNKKQKPTNVVLHCSATPDALPHDKRWYDLDIEEVRRWHIEDNGWRDVGYHFFIKRDGTLQKGRKIREIGAHTKGQNHKIGICYAGTRAPTAEQKETLRKLYRQLLADFDIDVEDWEPHNKYANKECPGFGSDRIKQILKGEDI